MSLGEIDGEEGRSCQGNILSDMVGLQASILNAGASLVEEKRDGSEQSSTMRSWSLSLKDSVL